MKNQRNINLRISDDLLEKLYYVAKSEGRTLNNEFLNLCTRFQSITNLVNSRYLQALHPRSCL